MEWKIVCSISLNEKTKPTTIHLDNAFELILWPPYVAVASLAKRMAMLDCVEFSQCKGIGKLSADVMYIYCDS